MAPADLLTALEREFRSCVLADRLQEAASGFERYAAELDRQLRAQPGPERLRELEISAGRLIEWATVMASASRQRAANECAQLRSLARYEAAAEARDLDARG